MSISEGRNDLAGNSSTNGWANISGQVYGFVDTSLDTDWFSTWLVAGTRYRFDMQGTTLDAVLVLRNAAGSVLGSADATAAGGRETLEFTPASTGLYYLDAQSYGFGASSTGFYVISLSSSARDDVFGDYSTAATLAVGQTRSGALEIPADADWYRVTLTAGQAYGFRASGTTGTPYLQVFDGDAIETGVFGSNSITFEPTRSGTYYIEVSGGRLTDTGSYSLSAWTLPQLAISADPVFEGAGTGASIRFTLSLSAPSPFDVSFRAFTRDGTALAGLDYQAVSRNITIPAGQTSTTVTVPVYGNTVFEPNRAFELTADNLVNVGTPASGWGIIVDDDPSPGPALPTDPYYGYQWYLYTVRAEFAWELATGRGVRVGVFDQGIDASHPDLRANTSMSLSRAAATLGSGGTPQLAGDNHGTYVAGVIGAARDGQGIVGVAYDATLVSIYSTLSASGFIKDIANAFAYAKNLDVLNNSWGFSNQLFQDTNWAFFDDAANPLFAPAFAALKDLVSNGRQGLGTVVVQSAGNAYSVGDDTNLHNFQNSRYIITVGSTDYHGRISPFSTYGASVLVSAPGGSGAQDFNSILTTDRLGNAGGSGGDYKFIDGTSFSAPVVSGVVAMMLEVNPRLGYRDVQQILAYTAQRIDVGVGEWRYNGARDWNGGGLHYTALDHATGFGQVDALAAVRLAAAWDLPPQTVGNTQTLKRSQVVNQPIPDGSFDGRFSAITVHEDLRVERVDVTVNIRHGYVGDLSILLSSPAGTNSFLLYRPSAGALSAYGSSQDDVRFTFDTVLSWGENARGTWTLGVFDAVSGDTGVFENWTIEFVGKAASNDDVYVYTNEYPALVAADPSRGVLQDTNGGSNTINAAALGLDNRIDLSGLGTSLLNGAPLRIAAGTRVDKAVGGSGDDVLIASDRGSVLRGMDGDDRLSGGRGADTLDGGDDLDVAVYALPRAQAVVSGGSIASRSVTPSGQGTDTLLGVERLQFSDRSIAYDLQGHAGEAAKLVGALFGPARLADAAFVGRWIGMLDAGSSYLDTVGAAVASNEFLALAGSRSHTAFVQLVYRNVVGVAPSTADLQHYTGLLNTGAFTQASLGLLAADTDINQLRVDLVGLGSTGLAYIPGG